MRYMLLIYAQEPAEAGDLNGAAISPPWMEYTRWLEAEGIHVGGARLATSTAATTVRVRGGDLLATDGPYAETKEVLGGYYILECDDIDRALEAAARCPGALTGSIEVRPIIGMAVDQPPTMALAAE